MTAHDRVRKALTVQNVRPYNKYNLLDYSFSRARSGQQIRETSAACSPAANFTPLLIGWGTIFRTVNSDEQASGLREINYADTMRRTIECVCRTRPGDKQIRFTRVRYIAPASEIGGLSRSTDTTRMFLDKIQDGPIYSRLPRNKKNLSTPCRLRVDKLYGY